MDITNPSDITQEEMESFLDQTVELEQKRRSQLRIIFDRFVRNKAAMVSAFYLIFMVLLCFLGPFVTGHNQPDVTRPLDSLKSPSLAFPLGTDLVGHDQFARIMVGGQLSLEVGLSSMLAGVILGVTIGAFAGFYGGLIDNVLMRVTDVALAVPTYLLLFLLSISFSDGSPFSITLIISAFSWTYAARLVRGEFLALREREYVLAARTIGARGLRLMFRHILPNAAGPIIVNATLLIGANIIFESVLSYFGFGLQPPAASWGNMVADGKGLLDVAPWMVLAPGLLIFLTVLSSNLIGDGLRDALDPRMTER